MAKFVEESYDEDSFDEENSSDEEVSKFFYRNQHNKIKYIIKFNSSYVKPSEKE
jgi:hypothetical protein